MTAARTLLLAPLRLPNADRVFFVGHGDQPPASEVLLYGYADDLRRATSDFAVAGLWTQVYFALKYDSIVSREMVLVASEEAVRALGFVPRVGRWPSTSEQETGAAVIVLTDWFWRERLGAPSQPLGSRIRVAGMSFTIIGVTPPTFQGFRPAPSFAGVIPAQSCRALGLGDWLTPTALAWRALGRLSPGVSMENVAQRLAHWRLDTLPGAHPLLPPNPPLRVVPARDWIVPLEQQTRLAPVFRGLAAASAVILRVRQRGFGAPGAIGAAATGDCDADRVGCRADQAGAYASCRVRARCAARRTGRCDYVTVGAGHGSARPRDAHGTCITGSPPPQSTLPLMAAFWAEDSCSPC